MNAPRHSRDDAYRLTDSESHRQYYDEWADSYDSEFAEEVGYIYPEAVGRRYLELARPADTPVADLGCGTGLAGLAFAGSEFDIDGFDISAGMLREASAKEVYRKLLPADLSAGEGLPRARYGGLISSGTFTLGHLGPADLENALTIARPGALCVVGINAAHFGNEGFGDRLTDLEKAGQITGFRTEQAPIYRNEDESDHVNLAKLAIFRISA